MVEPAVRARGRVDAGIACVRRPARICSCTRAMLSSSTMEPGYLGLVPVFFALPCRTCAAPGEPCQCGGICCAHCGQICAAQLQGESSPRVIEFSPGATGGSEDNELKDNSVYKLLAALFTTPNQWSCVEDGLYIRSQLLPELGVCYITDEECNTRPLGALSTWINIAQVLSHHHTAIVVFHLTGRTTFVFKAGKDACRKDPKSALRYLRSCRTGLGLLVDGDDDVRVFSHVDAWWSADDMRPCAEPFIGDRVAMAVVRCNTHVEYWWG